MYLWLLDRDAAALADLDTYVGLHPEAPYPHHLRARILAEMGDTEGARVAEETYQTKTDAVEPLTIELPDLPDELPETDLSARDSSWRKWLAPPDSVEFAEAVEAANADIDPVKLARAVASSNADPLTRGLGVQVLQKGFDPQELGETVPWLELAVRRRLVSHGPAKMAAELLGGIGHPSSIAVVADLALDMQGGPRYVLPVERALLLFPADVARQHLFWVAVQKRERHCFGLVESMYGPERRYWQAQWELIVGGRPEERLAAAATARDMLGNLTLYEMATDAGLDAAMRTDALQALLDDPNTRPRQLADLVETAQAAGE